MVSNVENRKVIRVCKGVQSLNTIKIYDEYHLAGQYLWWHKFCGSMRE